MIFPFSISFFSKRFPLSLVFFLSRANDFFPLGFFRDPRVFMRPNIIHKTVGEQLASWYKIQKPLDNDRVTDFDVSSFFWNDSFETYLSRFDEILKVSTLSLVSFKNDTLDDELIKTLFGRWIVDDKSIRHFKRDHSIYFALLIRMNAALTLRDRYERNILDRTNSKGTFHMGCFYDIPYRTVSKPVVQKTKTASVSLPLEPDSFDMTTVSNDRSEERRTANVLIEDVEDDPCVDVDSMLISNEDDDGDQEIFDGENDVTSSDSFYMLIDDCVEDVPNASSDVGDDGISIEENRNVEDRGRVNARIGSTFVTIDHKKRSDNTEQADASHRLFKLETFLGAHLNMCRWFFRRSNGDFSDDNVKRAIARGELILPTVPQRRCRMDYEHFDVKNAPVFGSQTPIVMYKSLKESIAFWGSTVFGYDMWASRDRPRRNDRPTDLVLYALRWLVRTPFLDVVLFFDKTKEEVKENHQTLYDALKYVLPSCEFIELLYGVGLGYGVDHSDNEKRNYDKSPRPMIYDLLSKIALPLFLKKSEFDRFQDRTDEKIASDEEDDPSVERAYKRSDEDEFVSLSSSVAFARFSRRKRSSMLLATLFTIATIESVRKMMIEQFPRSLVHYGAMIDSFGTNTSKQGSFPCFVDKNLRDLSSLESFDDFDRAYDAFSKIRTRTYDFNHACAQENGPVVQRFVSNIYSKTQGPQRSKRFNDTVEKLDFCLHSYRMSFMKHYLHCHGVFLSRRSIVERFVQVDDFSFHKRYSYAADGSVLGVNVGKTRWQKNHHEVVGSMRERKNPDGTVTMRYVNDETLLKAVLGVSVDPIQDDIYTFFPFLSHDPPCNNENEDDTFNLYGENEEGLYFNTQMALPNVTNDVKNVQFWSKHSPTMSGTQQSSRGSNNVPFRKTQTVSSTYSGGAGSSATTTTTTFSVFGGQSSFLGNNISPIAKAFGKCLIYRSQGRSLGTKTKDTCKNDPLVFEYVKKLVFLTLTGGYYKRPPSRYTSDALRTFTKDIIADVKHGETTEKELEYGEKYETDGRFYNYNVRPSFYTCFSLIVKIFDDFEHGGDDFVLKFVADQPLFAHYIWRENLVYNVARLPWIREVQPYLDWTSVERMSDFGTNSYRQRLDELFLIKRINMEREDERLWSENSYVSLIKKESSSSGVDLISKCNHEKTFERMKKMCKIYAFTKDKFLNDILNKMTEYQDRLVILELEWEDLIADLKRCVVLLAKNSYVLKRTTAHRPNDSVHSSDERRGNIPSTPTIIGFDSRTGYISVKSNEVVYNSFADGSVSNVVKTILKRYVSKSGDFDWLIEKLSSRRVEHNNNAGEDEEDSVHSIADAFVLLDACDNRSSGDDASRESSSSQKIDVSVVVEALDRSVGIWKNIKAQSRVSSKEKAFMWIFSMRRFLSKSDPHSNDEYMRKELHRVLKDEGLEAYAKLRRLYPDKMKPKSIFEIFETMSVTTFCKLYFLFRTLSNAASIRMLKIDRETSEKIHHAMIHRRYGIFPDLEDLPESAYDVYFTSCCGRMATSHVLGSYGQTGILYDYETDRYVCSRKSKKKPLLGYLNDDGDTEMKNAYDLGGLNNDTLSIRSHECSIDSNEDDMSDEDVEDDDVSNDEDCDHCESSRTEEHAFSDVGCDGPNDEKGPVNWMSVIMDPSDYIAWTRICKQTHRIDFSTRRNMDNLDEKTKFKIAKREKKRKRETIPCQDAPVVRLKMTGWLIFKHKGKASKMYGHCPTCAQPHEIDVDVNRGFGGYTCLQCRGTSPETYKVTRCSFCEKIVSLDQSKATLRVAMIALDDVDNPIVRKTYCRVDSPKIVYLQKREGMRIWKARYEYNARVAVLKSLTETTKKHVFETNPRITFVEKKDDEKNLSDQSSKSLQRILQNMKAIEEKSQTKRKTSRGGKRTNEHVKFVYDTDIYPTVFMETHEQTYLLSVGHDKTHAGRMLKKISDRKRNEEKARATFGEKYRLNMLSHADLEMKKKHAEDLRLKAKLNASKRKSKKKMEKVGFTSDTKQRVPSMRAHYGDIVDSVDSSLRKKKTTTLQKKRTVPKKTISFK